MILQTKHFGEIGVERENIVIFNDGLPGFESAKEFIIIDSLEAESPFKWLQCTNHSDLAFAVVNPFFIKKDYDFEINDEAVRRLQIEKEEDVAVYAILVVPEDLNKISMNLKAPVIININTKKAAQIILDTDKYTVRHYILDEIRRQEVGGNAGTDKEKGSIHRNK